MDRRVVGAVIVVLAVGVLAVGLWVLRPEPVPESDYQKCVRRCAELLQEEGPSRAACVEGCAEVAEPMR